MQHSSWRLLAVVCLAASLGLVLSCSPDVTPAAPKSSPLPPRAATTAPVAAPEHSRSRALGLSPGARVVSPLEAGEVDVYPLSLVAGQFYDFLVLQKGLDVELKLYGPDGRLLRRVDSMFEATGSEPLPVVAQNSGAHTLEIRPFMAAASGEPRYELILRAVRPATLRDRTLVQAEDLFFQADALGSSPAAKARKIVLYRQAVEIFRGLGEDLRRADALYAIGYFHHFQAGEEPEAVLAFAEALPIFEATKRTLEIARTEEFLGYCQLGRSEPRVSISHYERALQLYRQIRNLPGQATALLQLGPLYNAAGKIELASRSFDAGLALARELQDEDLRASGLQDLGLFLNSLGDFEGALDRLAEALTIRETFGKPGPIAQTLGAIAHVYRDAHENEKSLEYLQRALLPLRQEGNLSALAAALNDLGVTYQWGVIDPDKAEQAYEEAVALYARLDNDFYAATARLNLCSLQEQKHSSAATEECLRQAVTTFRDGEYPDRAAIALESLADAQAHRGDLEAARNSLNEAIAWIEKIRTGSASTDLRASLFARRQRVFSTQVEVLFRLHQKSPARHFDREAFDVSERARARSLLDLFRETGGQARKSAPPSLVREESRLGDQIEALAEERLRLRQANAEAEQLAGTDRRLRSLKIYADRLDALIRQAHPRAGAADEAQPLTAEQLQREILDPDTLLLEYSLGEARSLLWIVTPTTFETVELPPKAKIEALAREVSSRLAAGETSLAARDTQALLARASDLLLGPLGGRALSRRLVVVPDGALAGFPFAALPLPAVASSPVSPSTPRLLLVGDHELISIPSASVLGLLRHRAMSSGGSFSSIAVIADPVVSRLDPRLPHLAPGTPPGSPPPAGSELAPLPLSAEEARSILRLAGSRASLAALGFQANLELITSGRLRRYQVLHFASHGLLDPDHPELSAIVLSLFDEQGRSRRGYLRALDIARLDLRPQLVVLSACNTAQGKQLRGEGMLGLSRAFFAAGAEKVLVSLWEVDDRATMKLMESFYRELLERRRTPSEALRAAQSELAAQPGWEAPYYWAGWVLQGDWR